MPQNDIPQNLPALAQVEQTIVIQYPSMQSIVDYSLLLQKSANDLTVDSDAMYGFAGEELRRVKAVLKKLEDERKAKTSPLDQAKKAIMDIFSGGTAPLSGAQQVIRSKMAAYEEEKRRIAELEQARLNAEIEKERVERAQALADEQKKLQELESQIEGALALGDSAQIQSLTTAAEAAKAEILAGSMSLDVTASPVILPRVAPKAEGISTRAHYSADCVDLLALVKFVAEHPEYIGLLLADQKNLNDMAKAFKGKGPQIPGVVFNAKNIIVARTV